MNEEFQKTIDELKSRIAELEKEAHIMPLISKTVPIPDRDYCFGEAPVTVEEYRVFCEATGRNMPEQPEPHRDDNPVTNVNFNDATDYAAWVQSVTDIETYIPSEDEWEHCCGDHEKYHEDIAVCNQSTIQPIKTKKPNNLGLYDMLGCVWEWTKSFYNYE